MNKLPKIYKNNINDLKNKVQNQYILSDNSLKDSNKKLSRKDLIRKINDIFNSNDYIYGVYVNIMYKNKEKNVKKIIGYVNNNLLTIDDEKINIDSICDIEVK